MTTNSPSRRGFLTATGGLALVAGTVLASAGGGALASSGRSAGQPKDEYDTLREKWRDLILGTGFDPTVEPYQSKLGKLGEDAQGFWSSMAPVSGSLWPDLPYGSASSAVTGSYNRLRTMAHAYAQPETGLTDDPDLLADVVTGLDHLYAEIYNESTTSFGNWWDWQIGSPQALLESCAIVDDVLTPEQRDGYLRAVDHFIDEDAIGNSTGANRVDLCKSLAHRGIIGRYAPKLERARDALSPVFPYVTSGDGFYADGSFVQHTWVPYTGTYGSVLLGGLAGLLALLADSTWQVTDPNLQNIFDTIENAYAPWIFNGLVMDGVSGRGISREGNSDHRRGHGLVAGALLLAEAASPEERERWRGMAKGWLRRDRYLPVRRNTGMSIPAMVRCLGVLADAEVEPVPEPVEHRLFHNMDRVTHRRPGWTASISMASSRISHYECGNGENLKGFHTGCGMLYWWGADFGNGQYADQFWPTVDPYRLPGITVSKIQLPDNAGGEWGAPKPNVTWVGGATDGEFAAVGQYLKTIGSTLRAKKSWFCVDDAIVCLGAGIDAADDANVETVVDNRNLGRDGVHPFVVDGASQPVEHPWSDGFGGATWAHIDGFGGYVFPDGTTLNALREERVGSWNDINQGGSTTQRRRRYLTMWVDHGNNPSDGTYAYVLMPGATPAATSARAADEGWLEILANTDQQQGIHLPSLGVTAVNAWLAGTVGPVTVDEPASVLIRAHDDGTATVQLSDPKRAVPEVALTWEQPVSEVVSKDESVTVLGTGDSLRLRIAVGGTAGATHSCTVRLG